MQSSEKQVKDLISLRNKNLKKRDNISRAEVDRLGENIFSALMDNVDALSCDFILESLTELGYAPSLLYDDNGRWAVVHDGTQPVVTGNKRLEGTMAFFCEKDQWFKTIRAALKFYLAQKRSARKRG